MFSHVLSLIIFIDNFTHGKTKPNTPIKITAATAITKEAPPCRA